MRSKTITDVVGDKIRVEHLAECLPSIRVWTLNSKTGKEIDSATAWLNSGMLRKHGQACIQIADEIDAGKEKK